MKCLQAAIIGTLLLWQPRLLARVGCMDNSWHLAKKYDHKEYHYVQCNCPCEKEYAISANGTCTKCKHWRKELFIYHDTTQPEKLINIARLEQYAARKVINAQNSAKKAPLNQD